MEFSEHSRQTRTSLDVSESRRPADLNLTSKSRMKPLSRHEREKTPPVPQRVFLVCFLGSASVDPKSAQSMLPCVIEVKRRGSRQDILLEVKVPFVRAVSVEGKKIVFEHKLQSISCFAQTALDHCCFSYLTKENPDTTHICYVFHAPEESTVQELFTTMRETTKELQHGSSGGGSLLRRDSSIGNIPILSSDPTHNTFQHFEVMYVGKIKVSHRKAPPTFIDEALEKFRLHDLEKLKVRTGQGRQRHGSGASVSSMPASNGDRLERSVSVRENELRTQVENLRYSSGSENSSLENLVGLGDSSTSAESLSRFPRAFSSNAISRGAGGSSEELVVPAGVRVRANSGDVIRSRAFSNGYNDMPRRGRSETMPSGSTELNRTMLFQIGKNELGLISLDKKLIILNKGFKDISHCSQGIKQSDHFGFICRDNNVDTYVGYVFKCQSQAVTDEIMGALKQAFTTAAALHLQQGNKSNFCDTCPMYWYYRLYCDVDGVGPNKAHMIILKYLETLTSDEQRSIRAKYEGADVNDPEVQNDIMMTLLRAMCENKQSKHMHTSEPIHKVDMGFLDKKNTSVIDDLKKKAKRSLTSSFENILKVHRKSQDAKEVFRERSHTIDADHSYHRTQSSSDETSPSEVATRKESLTDFVDSPRDAQPSFRPRSSTVGGTMDLRREQKRQTNQPAKPKHSPMMNIFMKVGNQAKTPPPQEDKTPQRKQSWRQSIFNRVVTPQNKQMEGAPHFMTLTPASPIEETQSTSASGRRSPASLRALWKKAIKEQILLIRMEKENKKLRANEVAIQNKKMKLDYEEITPCLKEVTKVWDQMLTHYNRPNEKFDRQKILDAVKAGVPRQKRGDIWQLLAEQHEPRNNCCLPADDVDFSVTYEDLLCRLTSHQHAILIDLNRTFPNHPYFSKRLGPGQLALFNLLKAYSLFDREVGYCQGLSFIAGVLLLHIEENAAFEMLKHMLFRLGLRKQYKPDMVALQIQMYQLSRLVRDKYPDLDEHLEQHEIAPTLYAAPWFLTLFASQFPLGFVARVFDLLFLYGMEVIFKVALVLLGNHKELLMQCHSFESVMEFLKTTLPSLGVIQMERTINQVFTMDIASQLHDYEVEYHVLQEEMFASPQRSSLDVMQQLEATNRNLTRKNVELCEQLDSAHSTIHNLETRMSNYQNSISRLETRVHELELERLNLKKTVETLRLNLPSPSSWEEASIETDLSLQLDADTPTSLTVTGASLDGDVTSPSSTSLGTDSTEGTEKASPDSSEEGLDEDDHEVATLTRISNGGLSVPRERNLSGESASSVFSNLSNSPIAE